MFRKIVYQQDVFLEQIEGFNSLGKANGRLSYSMTAKSRKDVRKIMYRVHVFLEQTGDGNSPLMKDAGDQTSGMPCHWTSQKLNSKSWFLFCMLSIVLVALSST